MSSAMLGGGGYGGRYVVVVEGAMTRHNVNGEGCLVVMALVEGGDTLRCQ